MFVPQYGLRRKSSIIHFRTHGVGPVHSDKPDPSCDLDISRSAQAFIIARIVRTGMPPPSEPEGGGFCLTPDYALKKVARAFLPVMLIIAGRNARTTFFNA